MTIHYEEFERERLDPIYDIIAPYSEMARNERYFLNGMIRYFKPRKILEVGVSNGGGSALILNAISDIEGAELYSVDYSEKAYRHPEKVSGFLVEEKFPDFMGKWHVFRGGDVSRFIEEIGGDIDMLVLDTAHIHPWETLNFLCILPFMKHSESRVILHDITLHIGTANRYELACRYLYASVVSEEKVTPEPEDKAMFANIGAFKVSGLTVKHAGNLIETLLIPWEGQISESDIKDIGRILEKYYTPEQYRFFCDILKIQEYMFRNPPGLRSKVKHYMLQKGMNIYSGMYSFLRWIYRHFKIFRK